MKNNILSIIVYLFVNKTIPYYFLKFQLSNVDTIRMEKSMYIYISFEYLGTFNVHYYYYYFSISPI